MVNTRIRNKESYMNYVCPYCFNTVDKCECECCLPHYIIWVDRGIQEHVRILNQKGYRTSESCESHGKSMNMYITFAYDYGFGNALTLPDGFKYKKRHNTISVLYNGKITDEEFERQKKDHLYNLLKWCESLPELR